MEPERSCWICLDLCEEVPVCKCKSHVHATCLAKWQLRQAGKPEEKRCRFCHETLSDYRYVLRPDYDDYKDTTIDIQVRHDMWNLIVPVDESIGHETFAKIACLEFGIPHDVFHDTIKFICTVPDEDTHVVFNGMDCWNAVVFCVQTQVVERRRREGTIQSVTPETKNELFVAVAAVKKWWNNILNKTKRWMR